MAIRSIRIKVISVIILVLALSVGVSIYITVTNQRSNLLDETRKNLTVTSEILNNVIRNIMLSGEAPIATSTLADIQGIEEFSDVAIYRTDGTNAFHDSATIDRVNMFIGKEVFEPTERAELRMIDNTHFKEVLATNTPVDVESPRERKFEYFFPILNYSECRSCHGETEFIRGIAHYEVSTAGIYKQITEARNTLTIFFVVSGAVIAFVLFITLRRIIINPLLTIGSAVEKVGGGNLEITVESGSQDELGSLASELNVMIGGLRDKSRLEIENSIIETRNQENRKYLENINEGLLLLDKDQLISEQYSTFLEYLFGTDEIEGMSFSDFIYPGESADSEARKDLDEFIEMIFTNLNTDMEMIMSINPLEDKTLVVQREGRRQEIIINATFLRITSADGDVENVMVIFEDKTALVEIERELETERARSETEIEHIQAILRSGPDSFIEFVADAGDVIQSLEAGMESLDNPETVNRLFRELHSLKGVARYMELRSFASTLHETEGLIAGVRDGTRIADSGLIVEIGERLEVLRGEVDGIRNINDRFKEFASGSRTPSTDGVSGLLENLERMANDIAGELGKTIQVSTRTEIENLPMLKELRDPIIHLLRNALDHGLEDGLERVSKGKEETGRIEINVLKSGTETCLIEIGDDGAGIDFQAVKHRAVELGIIGDDSEPTNAQILKILFLPAFSSRTTASELSGRGVGLDAVHSAISKLGGTISVATRKDIGTKISLKVPLEGENS